MHQQKRSTFLRDMNNNALTPSSDQSFLIQPPARVEPPSEPTCYQNPDFRLTIQQIFLVFYNHFNQERIFVSGGCLSRSYIDPEMEEGHKQSFGDIDFKLPLCTQEEIRSLLNYLKLYQEHDGDMDEKHSFFCTPFALAFHDLLSAGGVLKKFYCKKQKTVVNYQSIIHRRIVVNIDWHGTSVDFVAFEESIEEHALRLDISVGAGFYNPYMEKIYFPCDEFLEPFAYNLQAPCDRSAKDFKNKELNLLFPKAYVALFDNDPIRILRIVQALSRSDYTLSAELEYSIQQYIEAHKNTVFTNINSDRFYYNLKTTFFSGHAVKNLAKLIELNLFDELFGYVLKLSQESKALTLYLVNRVAIESDSDFLLSPSLLFYAVYWDVIKNKSYNPYLILELSGGAIRIPIEEFKKNKRSNEDDFLNERIHQENIECLTLWETKYSVERERTFEDSPVIEMNSMREADQAPILLNDIGESVKPFYDGHTESTNVTFEQAENLIPVAPLIKPQPLKTVTKRKPLKSKHAPALSITESSTIPKEVTVNKGTEKINEKQKLLIQEAMREEDLGRYQKAIDIYIKFSVGSNTIMARHKCIELYVKLNQYDNAIKYVNRLVDMPENDYNHRYNCQETPFDNYQYHHYYSLYQRGKSHLKSGQIKEAIRDFSCIIQRYILTKNENNNAFIELAMRTYIKAGKALHQLACAENEKLIVNGLHDKNQTIERDTSAIQQRKKIVEAGFLGVRKTENDAKQAYENAKILINELGPDFYYKSIPVYLELGKVEQSQGNLAGPKSAKEHYEAVLNIIDDNIKNNVYPRADSIYQALYQCAEYISGNVINQMTWMLLQKKSFSVLLSDITFLEFSKEIYLKSVLYSSNTFQHAHVQLIRIDLILNQYDAAILQIERMLLGDLKSAQCCQRELFLFLGECYERKAMYDVALEYYKKNQVFRYEDDNNQCQELMALAQNAIKRVTIEKEATKQAILPEQNVPPSVQNTIHALGEPELPTESICTTDEMWLQVGKEAQLNGAYKQAIDSYTSAIQLNSKHLESYRSRIDAYICMDQYEDALKDCAFLMSIDESEYQNYKTNQKPPFDQYEYYLLYVRCQRGTVYLAIARDRLLLEDDRALRDFDYIIKQCAKSKNQDFRSLLAYAYSGRGQFSEAGVQAMREQYNRTKAFEKTQHHEHDTDEIRKTLKKGFSGALSVINVLEEGAISAYKKTIECCTITDQQTIENSPLLGAYQGLANIAKVRVEFVLGKETLNKQELRDAQRNLNRAESYYLKAIQLEPKLVEIHLELGRIEDLRSRLDLSKVDDNKKHQSAAKVHYLNSIQFFPHYKEPYLRLGILEQFQGDAIAAKTYYRTYMFLIRAEMEKSAVTTPPEYFYETYSLLAEMIFSGEKIVITAKKILFSVENSTTLSDFDFEFMDILTEIYSETVRYSPSVFQDAHLKLIFIAIILKNYDDAIERIQALENLTNVQISKREVFYICAKMHEIKENYSEAKKYYRLSINLNKSEHDDERSPQIISCAMIFLKKIITNDIVRARALEALKIEEALNRAPSACLDVVPSNEVVASTTIEEKAVVKKATGIGELNMFVEQAKASSMDLVQRPSGEIGMMTHYKSEVSSLKPLPVDSHDVSLSRKS